MTREEVLNTIKTLAQSQGIYSRVLQHLENSTEEQRNSLLDIIGKSCKNKVDIVLFMEN